MVKIKIGKDEGTRTLILRAKGHAGFSTRGQDVVCAAVSAQLIGFAEAARTLSISEGCERYFAEVGKVSGTGIVEVTASNDETFDRLCNMFLPAEIFLERLGREYEGFVEFERLGDKMSKDE